jgi:hypothetical protein
MYAGDTLPGHPPIPIDTLRARDRGGFLLGVLSTLAATLTVVIAWARSRPGFVVDVIGLGAATYGVALWFGPGPAWVCAGVSVLLAHQYADKPPTRPDGP